MTFRFFLKLLVAVAAMTLLMYFSDTNKLRQVIGLANYAWVLAGTLVFLAGQFIASQRWRSVLLAGGVVLSPLSVYQLHLAGVFSGNFLPGQAAGDVVKAALLFDRYPERKAFLMASVVYDRLLGLCAMLALALLAAGVFALRGQDVTMLLFYGGVALSVLLSLVLILGHMHRLQLPLLPKLMGRSMASRLGGFSGCLGELLQLRRLALRSFTLGLLFQLSWAVCLWLMIWAVAPGISLLMVLLAAALSVLAATVPVSLGGLGVREGVFALIIQRLGGDLEVAAAASLLAILPLLVASIAGALLLGITDFGCARGDE